MNLSTLSEVIPLVLSGDKSRSLLGLYSCRSLIRDQSDLGDVFRPVFLIVVKLGGVIGCGWWLRGRLAKGSGGSYNMLIL